MKNPFLKAVSTSSNLRSFIDDNTYNSLKYSGESGLVNTIYFPYHEVTDAETGEPRKELIALSAKAHSWESYDAFGKKIFGSTVCTEGAPIITDAEGRIMSDGICPICARERDSRAIFDYRRAILDGQYGGVPAEGTKERKSYDEDVRKLRDESKIKTVPQMYILVAVVKMSTNSDGSVSPATLVDGMPAYQLKIWKATVKKVKELREKLAKSRKTEFGAEVYFTHPTVVDPKSAYGRMQLVSGMTMDVVGSDMSLSNEYPKLFAKMQADALGVMDTIFDTVEKSFPEFKPAYKENLVLEMDKLFSAWDEYQKELLENPQAKYLEYAATGKAVTNPAVAVGSAQSAPIGGMAMIGDVPQMEAMPKLAVAESELVSGDGIAEI